MKKYLLLFIAIVLVTQVCGSQLSNQLSTGKAALYSAMIPGLGELYIGNSTRAGIFLGAELLIVLSYLRIHQETEWKTNSYMQYASRYAGVEIPAEDSYYRLISNYVSSDVYNAEVERYYRNRCIVYEYRPELYDLYTSRFMITGADAWTWESTDNWLRYREIRRDKQRLEILGNFAIGAAVLNRLVSVIDTALLAKKGNSAVNSFSNFTIQPDFERIGYRVNYEFKF